MLKRFIFPIIILLVAIAIVMAMNASKPEKKTLTRPEKVWRVKTVTVQLQQIAPEITIYGRVETPRQATLNAAISADVTEVNILEGAVVAAGDQLITLDHSDAALILAQRQADLAETNALMSSEISRQRRDKGLLTNEKALLVLTEKAVDRAKKLDASRLVTRSSLDDAIANQQRQVVTVKRLKYDISEHPARLAGLTARQARAQAILAQAKLNVERAYVNAPFNGRIANLTVSIGDRVRIGDNLLSIYDLDQLEVRAQIPGRHLKQVRNDLAAGHYPQAISTLDGTQLAFELTRLSGETREDSGGVDGLFNLITEDQTLALGTFIELSLSLDLQKNVAVIPFNALYGLNRVYRINEGYLEAVSITRVGEYESDNGQTQLLIRSVDLKEGDQVISTQLPNAITGLRVEAMNDGV